MTDEKLRRILSDWIEEDFTIVVNGTMEGETLPDGEVVSARDVRLRRYRLWLHRLMTTPPRVAIAEQTIQDAIQALEKLSPQDEVIWWEACSQTKHYRGLCSHLGMITIYKPEPIEKKPDAPSEGGEEPSTTN